MFKTSENPYETSGFCWAKKVHLDSEHGLPESLENSGKQANPAFQQSRGSYNQLGDMPMSCGPASKFHVVRQSLTAEKLGNQSYHEWDQHPLLPARGAPATAPKCIRV